jgi:predicted nucleic acid-binding protein
VVSDERGDRSRAVLCHTTVTTYIDSSVLVAVYVPGRFSRAAREAVRTAGQVRFTTLHRLEVPNAFELLVGRGAITPDGRRAIERHLHEDVEAQRLAPVAIDLDRVFADASELSRTHSATFFTRILDLLHVAAAHVIGCTMFVSADDRQLAVAKATRLKTTDIKRRSRRP